MRLIPGYNDHGQHVVKTKTIHRCWSWAALTDMRRHCISVIVLSQCALLGTQRKAVPRAPEHPCTGRTAVWLKAPARTGPDWIGQVGTCGVCEDAKMQRCLRGRLRRGRAQQRPTRHVDSQVLSQDTGETLEHSGATPSYTASSPLAAMPRTRWTVRRCRRAYAGCARAWAWAACTRPVPR
jgi:hypothetical protein